MGGLWEGYPLISQILGEANILSGGPCEKSGIASKYPPNVFARPFFLIHSIHTLSASYFKGQPVRCIFLGKYASDLVLVHVKCLRRPVPVDEILPTNDEICMTMAFCSSPFILRLSKRNEFYQPFRTTLLVINHDT